MKWEHFPMYLKSWYNNFFCYYTFNYQIRGSSEKFLSQRKVNFLVKIVSNIVLFRKEFNNVVVHKKNKNNHVKVELNKI